MSHPRQVSTRKSPKWTIYCNATALPPERFWWKATRRPASAIRSRKLSINVATIKAWARPTLEILPKSQNQTNEYLAICVNSYFLVWLVVTRLVVILYSKHSPGLCLSSVSLRWPNSSCPCEPSISFLYPYQPKYLPVQCTNQFREIHFLWILKFVTLHTKIRSFLGVNLVL